MQLLPHSSQQANLREQEAKIDRLFIRLGTLDHYSLLGVPRDAERPLIQRAHALRRMLYQSLITASQAPAGHAKVRAIVSALDVAWETLSDASRRAEYDLRIAASPATSLTPLPPAPEVFSRVQRAQEVFSTPVRTPSQPPPPREPAKTPAPSLPRPSVPPPVGVMPALAELVMNQAFANPNTRGETPTIRPPSMPRAAAAETDDSMRAPRAPTRPSPGLVAEAPVRQQASRLDPWESSSLAAPNTRDDLAKLCTALQVTLTALSEERPYDRLVADARHSVSEVQVRHAVHTAHEQELQGRWAQAARSWMQAARCMPEDPWLLAHAARALLLSNAAPSETIEVARRALDIDPANSLATSVLWRAQG